ncbi:MAG TPA: hypothetical protein VHX60_15875 [Acidobacteriaceae bacterium]|jgi:hypothetical protein|nr:hypothetical protein [Acidobacteriaceae bacterium]
MRERKVRASHPVQSLDSLPAAVGGQVLGTGTGPTRLEEWLPVPGPVLVEHPKRRGSAQPGGQARPWTWVEGVVLAGFALVVAIGLSWHEPWADEAQAWLLARDSGWWTMMAHSIRYEGSPGLWHSLLWVLAHAHVGYTGMRWIAGGIAAAGVYLLLRYSPFPLILRILLPFGFWLAYQDAVVARSYVLFGVLAFGAATLIRGMSEEPAQRRWGLGKWIGLAVVLGLMANLSVHGFVASVGFAVVAAMVARRRGGTRAAWLAPALIVACFWAIAVMTTIPPPDLNFQAGASLNHAAEKLWASAGDRQAGQTDTDDVRPGELAQIPPVRDHWTAPQALWRKVARVLALLTFPVSNFRWLALAACLLAGVQALWFGRWRDFGSAPIGWIGLLPWALMLAVFSSMVLSPRHAGMVWTALVASLWLTWPGEHAGRTGAGLWLRHITVAVLVLVAMDQVYWTAHSVRAEVRSPYSGDLAMARFLRKAAPGKRVAGFYSYAVGPAAWFRHRLYFNQPHAWWLWSRNVRTNQQAPATIATHPDIIVVGGEEQGVRNARISDDWIPADPSTLRRGPLGDSYGVIAYAEAHGYRETHRFCGQSWMRDGWAEKLCEVALEPR